MGAKTQDVRTDAEIFASFPEDIQSLLVAQGMIDTGMDKIVIMETTGYLDDEDGSYEASVRKEHDDNIKWSKEHPFKWGPLRK